MRKATITTIASTIIFDWAQPSELRDAPLFERPEAAKGRRARSSAVATEQ
jgi:hypothetical protein